MLLGCGVCVPFPEPGFYTIDSGGNKLRTHSVNENIFNITK